LSERRAAGTTVLLSTHQMNKVEEVCDRALMMNQGRMVLHGAGRDIRRQHADHAVLLRSEDRLASGAGVREIQSSNGDYKLLLEPETTPESVLRTLMDRHVRIESFALASLPLEDVFVKVVREGLGLEPSAAAAPP